MIPQQKESTAPLSRRAFVRAVPWGLGTVGLWLAWRGYQSLQAPQGKKRERPFEYMTVHQDSEFAVAGQQPSIEYFLPVRGMPKNDRAQLHPWLAQLASLTPEQAGSALQKRWQPDLNGPLADLLTYLLEYQPKSIVVQDRKGWLLCTRPATSTMAEDTFLLPPPVPPEAVAASLKQHGFKNSVLKQFLSAVGGMRETFAPAGGAFVEANESWSFLNEPALGREVNGYADWEGSMLLFNGSGGDDLIVHPEGNVGWWVKETAEILEYSVKFADFCKQYAEYRRSAWVKVEDSEQKVPWPFTPAGYPAPE